VPIYVNMVLLKPNSDQITAYYIPQEEIRGKNQSQLINSIKMQEDLVVSWLPFQYENYKQGLYVTTIDNNELPSSLDETLSINMEKVKIGSSSYVATNLLRNAFKKSAQKDLTRFNCKKESFGEDFCIELDHRDALNLNLSDYLFDKFCDINPELCGEKDSECSKLFNVVKRYFFKFQHVKEGNKDAIYLVINFSYGVRQNLVLKHIISLIGNNINYVIGTIVNVKHNRSYTEVCSVKSVDIKSNKIKLECYGKERELDMDSDALITINPVYKSSRSLLQKICANFDEHKYELSSKVNPKVFYDIITNDLNTLVKLIDQYLVLNGIKYNLDNKLAVVI